jgi:alkylation response protein AidB-like acyl-CoA dehydrogenase
MDYRDTPEEAAFRAEARAWFADNTSVDWTHVEDEQEQTRLRREWHQKLYKAGYAGMAWPVEYGGGGLNAVYSAILAEVAVRTQAPQLPPYIGYMGAAIQAYGSEEQKRHFLPTMLSGEIAWCQGFSEPEAGSDIASLRTRAVLEGDEWVVNGQKMWTSGAHEADWCFLLVRTEPDLPKHKGITCLLTSMDTPGIEVRKIYLSNGIPETSEVFFDNVRIPASQMLGQRGDGWPIAMTTVSFERGPIEVGAVQRYEIVLEKIEQAAAQRGLLEDPRVRSELALAYARGQALRLASLEELSARVSGVAAGAAGSLCKLLWSESEQALQSLSLDVLGVDAWTSVEADKMAEYFSARAVSVYGGTAQIQKNIVAQRILGMPR